MHNKTSCMLPNNFTGKPSFMPLAIRPRCHFSLLKLITFESHIYLASDKITIFVKHTTAGGSSFEQNQHLRSLSQRKCNVNHMHVHFSEITSFMNKTAEQPNCQL